MAFNIGDVVVTPTPFDPWPMIIRKPSKKNLLLPDFGPANALVRQREVEVYRYDCVTGQATYKLMTPGGDTLIDPILNFWSAKPGQATDQAKQKALIQAFLGATKFPNARAMLTALVKSLGLTTETVPVTNIARLFFPRTVRSACFAMWNTHFTS
mmetsp:Transcript_18122/g.28089  ORF Transcript_18122/g.28089 Transcript_18122/m.28089 type:complete len:155 (+) Transcript_18122:1406-1870(+)